MFADRKIRLWANACDNLPGRVDGRWRYNVLTGHQLAKRTGERQIIGNQQQLLRTLIFFYISLKLNRWLFQYYFLIISVYIIHFLTLCYPGEHKNLISIRQSNFLNDPVFFLLNNIFPFISLNLLFSLLQFS